MRQYIINNELELGIEATSTINYGGYCGDQRLPT
jgi:hypothetical protein